LKKIGGNNEVLMVLDRREGSLKLGSHEF